MNLGNFSVSLAVKDIKISKDFYDKLGFSVVGGNEDQGWLVVKNGTTKIGLFQDMFEKNILTFNPGWDSDGNEVNSFTDVRELQKKLQEAGIKLTQEAEQGRGPTSFTLLDPDENPILIDQHRSRPD